MSDMSATFLACLIQRARSAQGGLGETPPGYESVLAGSTDFSQIMSSLRLGETGAISTPSASCRALSPHFPAAHPLALRHQKSDFITCTSAA